VAEGKDNATRWAEAAFARMREMGISPTPPNFAVWYSYFAGDNPELKRALDEMLTAPDQVTDAASVDTYNRFMAGRDPFESGIEFSQRIQSSAEQVLQALDSAGTGAKRYGMALENFSGTIESAGGAVEVKRLIKGILAETKAMEQHNHRLRTEVETSSKEIKTLKGRLEDARRDAMTDPLTGVFNRKAFDRAIREHISRSEETSDPVGMVLCDLDHFKSFNDNFGHQVGDQVLRLVAQTLVQCVKGQDVVARYGGEEFVVILPQTNVMGAAAVAEFIRRTVEQKKIVRKGTNQPIGQITLSLGVASLVAGDGPEELIERADRALYTAKAGGRNRVFADKGLKVQDAVNG
jgi:diguanylate cyclase